MSLHTDDLIEGPITTERLIDLAGLSDAPEFEARNGKAVSAALFQLRGSVPQLERTLIYNELAALHLPALVTAFKRQRAINGAAAHLISTCANVPHFVRYAQRPEAADLHKIHAKRLLSNTWNEGVISFEYGLQNSLQLFSSLLIVWGTDFDRDIRARLVRQLREWKKVYPNVANVQTYADRCLHLIRPMGATGVDMQMAKLPYMRNVFAKGVASCRFPGCVALAANTTLRACPGCKVRYCSLDHQNRDWREHEPLCITPAF